MKYYWARYANETKWFVVREELVGAKGVCYPFGCEGCRRIQKPKRLIIGPEIPGPPEEWTNG